MYLLTSIGVLQRHESLAANLGAKLVGPLLLKSFEKLFDGPIKITQTSYALEQSPVTWLDIVTFARTNPSEFALTESPIPGHKYCRFWIHGGQVEVSEDDYRLIMSGAPERMIPTQPIPEDESAELGTLNILESRLTMLIKKADAVASKARQLNYHLKGRKTAVLSRKVVEQPVSVDESHSFSPQPFSAINARIPIPPNGETAKIQQQLLEQFTTSDRRPSTSATHPHHRPKPNRISTSDFPASTNDERRMSHPLTSSEDGTEGQYRVLMASKIEKLARGGPIYPPCDRCRRLRFECTKHLTACQACTKKHAKCSWKDIKEGELDYVPQLPVVSNNQEQENGYGGGNGGEGQNEQRNVTPNVMISQNLAPTQGMGIQEMERLGEEQERERDMANEHAMLTQIASAAAAASR
jgi:hypothetical protein